MEWRGYWIEKTRAGYVATKRGDETITDPDSVGICRRIDEHISLADLVRMNPYLATGIAEGFIEPENEEQVTEAWQYLHDTGTAYQLQGWFGRTAQALIADGSITA